MPTQAFPFYGTREAANRAAYRLASEVDCDPPDDRGIWRDADGWCYSIARTGLDTNASWRIVVTDEEGNALSE
jgi:hypothetical protein